MKRALIAAGIVFLLVFSMVTFVMFHRVHAVLARAGHQPVPADLQQAEVVSGADSFIKSVDFTASPIDLVSTSPGLITDIEPLPDNAFLLVGRKGALTLAADHSAHNEAAFPTCFGPITATRLGNGSFFCHSDLMSGPKLLDAAGKTLWTFKDNPTAFDADDAVPGELGPDHTPVVAVGMNGGGGVRLLDANGNQLWSQHDGNVWHIEIAPTPKGNVIVHSNAAGQLTLRDITGNAIVHCKPAIFLDWFSLTPWADDPQPNHLIAAKDGAFYILNLEGATAAKLPAPLLHDGGASSPHGIPVHFSAGPAAYAALQSVSAWNRSVLYIYDAAHNPIYSEVLDESCASLQTTPQTNGTQALLVGCKNQLLRYTSAHTS